MGGGDIRKEYTEDDKSLRWEGSFNSSDIRVESHGKFTKRYETKEKKPFTFELA